jgi:hypothetical protein
VVINAAAALRLIFHALGPQQARDLALTLIEGDDLELIEGDDLELIEGDDPKAKGGFRLRHTTMKGRSGHLQRKTEGKLRSGQMRPQPEIVLSLALAFRGRDAEAALRQLVTLSIVSPARFKQFIARMCERPE